MLSESFFQGLDTVEDDMQTFVGRAAEKLAHLRAFASYLSVPDFHMVRPWTRYSSKGPR
jgi:hypothetical protein